MHKIKGIKLAQLRMIEHFELTISLSSILIYLNTTMMSERQRQQEEFKKELLKKGKKEMLLPLARLLRIAEAQSSRREQCAFMIARSLAQQLQICRVNKMNPNECVQSIVTRLASQNVSYSAIIAETREIMKKVLRISEIVPQQRVINTSQLSNLRDSKNCVCTWTRVHASTQQQITCTSCFKQFHKQCFQVRGDYFQCPYCALEKMDPLNQVIQCFYICFFKGERNRTLQFTCSKPITSSDEVIEIRCVRIDGENHQHHTWPDIGQLMFNGESCETFKPLGVNVSQKKRRDSTAIIENFRTANTLAINFNHSDYKRDKFRIGNHGHFLGVFRVKRLRPNDLFEQIKRNVLRFEKSQELLRKNLRIPNSSETQQLQIPQIKINLICTYSSERINIPVRGKLCKHFACFDLYNVIHMNTNSRKWICPLCHQKINELFVDPILLQIIKLNPDAVAVYLSKFGEPRVVIKSRREASNDDYQVQLPKKKVHNVINPNFTLTVDSDLQDNSQKNLFIKKDHKLNKNSSSMTQITQQTTQRFTKNTFSLNKITPDQKKSSNKMSRSQYIKSRQLKKQKLLKQSASFLDRIGSIQKKVTQVVILSSDEEPQKIQNSQEDEQQEEWLEQVRTMSILRFNTERTCMNEETLHLEEKVYRALRQLSID